MPSQPASNESYRMPHLPTLFTEAFCLGADGGAWLPWKTLLNLALKMIDLCSSGKWRHMLKLCDLLINYSRAHQENRLVLRESPEKVETRVTLLANEAAERPLL